MRYEQATYNEFYTRVYHRTESRIRSYAILDVEMRQQIMNTQCMYEIVHELNIKHSMRATT